MKQYQRKWALHIDGQPYIESRPGANFRIVFDIAVSTMNTVSFADIRVYNLKESAALVQGRQIQLIAGYEDSCDTIFSGTITNTFKERQGADIATRMLCRSGIANQDRGSANHTFPANTNVVDVIRYLAQQWPRFLEIEPDHFAGDPLMTSGYTAQGDIPKILDSLATQYQFSWTQHLGALVVTKNDRERQTPAFDINALSGMRGIPEVSRGPNGMGVTVSTRINPYIRANSRINIQSRFSTYNTGNQFIAETQGDLSADGIYNVLTMQYEGDSHGDAWDLHIDGLRPGTAPLPEALAPGALVWGANVTQEFRNKVREIANRQRLDPNWYMAIMAFETGEKFKSYTPNAAGGSAIGLIQFMPFVAVELGTTSQKLAMMTEVQQLDYVEKYFDKYKSRIRSLSDMYMAVLWPVATGWPVDAVIWDRDGDTAREYRANSGLDTNGDGKITKKEAAKRVFDSLSKGKARAK